jgi:hypothetical protein
MLDGASELWQATRVVLIVVGVEDGGSNESDEV